MTHIRILGAHHCGNIRCEAFKSCVDFQNVLCDREFIEQVVTSFSQQIKYEYYGSNMYVSIEGITLKHFSASTHLFPLY